MSQDKEELMRDEDKKKDLRNKIETTSCVIFTGLQ